MHVQFQEPAAHRLNVASANVSALCYSRAMFAIDLRQPAALSSAVGTKQAGTMAKAKTFKIGDRVGWNSEAGQVSGRIVRVRCGVVFLERCYRVRSRSSAIFPRNGSLVAGPKLGRVVALSHLSPQSVQSGPDVAFPLGKRGLRRRDALPAWAPKPARRQADSIPLRFVSMCRPWSSGVPAGQGA
jgi:hypothetical protein